MGKCSQKWDTIDILAWLVYFMGSFPIYQSAIPPVTRLLRLLRIQVVAKNEIHHMPMILIKIP
jgi:hypothetical protein